MNILRPKCNRQNGPYQTFCWHFKKGIPNTNVITSYPVMRGQRGGGIYCTEAAVDRSVHPASVAGKVDTLTKLSLGWTMVNKDRN